MRRPVIVLTVVAAMIVAGQLAAVAQPAEMPPGIMWHSLLASTTVYSNTGNFTLSGFERMVAVFLPPAQSNTVYPYNPTDGGKFWAILKDADGTELLRYDLWAAERPAPYWSVDDSWVTDLATGERVQTGQVPLPPGDYTADFYLDSGRFYTFSFSISQITSDDPFNPQSFSFLEGPWRDWGALTYADAEPSNTLYWVIFLRNKGREASKSVSLEVQVTRDADGAVVCTTRPGMSWSLMREWRSHRLELVRPGGVPCAAADLLSRDGAYTLRMTMDGQNYGTWKFNVAGGKLQYTGRTVRGEADPLEFVEGGTNQWWYVRQESGQAAAAAPAATGAQAGTGTNGAAATAPPATTAPAQAAGAPEVIEGATPITVNGHTMVPLRSVFEWLGADVKWVPQALTIYASRGDDQIVMMRLDESEATVNAKKVPLPQPPVQQGGVTYVPLRFSAEAFGATVGFDDATGAITITDGERVGVLPR